MPQPSEFAEMARCPLTELRTGKESTYEGTNQIQREVIGLNLIKESASRKA